MQSVSLILAFAAAAMLIAFSTSFISSPFPTGEAIPKSGMAVIEAYACNHGETKRVAIRGVEDNYAPGNDEPASLHPRLENVDFQRGAAPADFDTIQSDTSVVDHFEIAPNTASAIVVVKAKPLGDNANDGIAIGDLATRIIGAKQSETRVYTEHFTRLGQTTRWGRSGDLYWASLGDLPLPSGGTLLELIRSSGRSRVVDVEVADDTTVDFIATAACEHPPNAHGVTVRHVDEVTPAGNEVALFDCKALAHCTPYTGNRPCTDQLPLLCYIDRQRPTPPAALPDPAILVRTWSGGEVAATAPVSAGTFKTIADADEHCAKQFGENWRVAEWHLGGKGASFSAMTGGRRFAGEYWIDIRGTRYGSCWKRDANDK